MQLQFKDNKFKILVIADLQDTNTPQKESTDMLKNSLSLTKPDLVVFLGDNINGIFEGANKETVKDAVCKAFKPVNDLKIPFCFVFGNHDCEGLTDSINKMTEIEAKEYIFNAANEFEYCLSEKGSCINSLGNYNIPVFSNNKMIYNLWFLDSGTYDKKGGYGYVNDEQINWYEDTAEKLKAMNNHCVPSILFQHIIVPEVYRLFKESKVYLPGSVKGQTALFKNFYRKSKSVIKGSLNEAPCCADVEHGQFRSWKDTGDIICAVFGHDHVNDFSGIVDEIFLQAVPAAGYYSYGNNHGVGLITLNNGSIPSFKSEIITSKQLLPYKVKPRYKAQHGYYEYMMKKRH